MIRIVKKFFVEDFGIKIWSLLLAILVWYAIQGAKEIEAFVQVGVQLKNRPAHLLVTNRVIEQITLRVRGSQTAIDRVKGQNKFVYAIDLAETVAGKSEFRLFPIDFKLPNDVQITRISPQSIMVNLEEQISRTLPVKPAYEGNLEQGFVLADTKVSPETIVVTGARSVVSLLKEIRTKPIRLNDIRATMSAEFPVLLPESEMMWIEDEGSVEVTLVIEERQVSGTIDEVPIEVRGDVNVVQLNPGRAKITVQAKAGLFNDLHSNKPKAYVDASKLKIAAGVDRKARLKVRVEPVQDCEIVAIKPSYADLVAKKR